MKRKMRLIIDYETDGQEGLLEHSNIMNELRRFFPYIARGHVELQSHSVKLLEHKPSKRKAAS